MTIHFGTLVGSASGILVCAFYSTSREPARHEQQWYREASSRNELEGEEKSEDEQHARRMQEDQLSA